jgi:hypothetical protein
MVQLKCPETGKPVDIRDASPKAAGWPRNLALGGTEIPCPHCSESHIWTTSHWWIAMDALLESPDATRILVDGASATALS